MLGIWNKCPYLTRDEIEACWNRAKAVASQRKKTGPGYWGVVAKIARGMAIKVDEERRTQDEEKWIQEQRDKFGRDWN